MLDPDHAHLNRLLAMLPGPEDGDFWKSIATANDTSLSYVFEKLSHIARFRNNPRPDGEGGYTISYLCTYLLMFFGGDRPDIHAAVAHHLFATGTQQPYTGEPFVRDLVDTAWRVFVRYRRTDETALAFWNNAHMRHR